MKKIIGPFAFLIILGLLVELSIFIFIPNKKNLFDFGIYNVSKYDILNEKNDSIDVIFLGDSLIYNSISPMYLWNKYGFLRPEGRLSFRVPDPDSFRYRILSERSFQYTDFRRLPW